MAVLLKSGMQGLVPVSFQRPASKWSLFPGQLSEICLAQMGPDLLRKSVCPRHLEFRVIPRLHSAATPLHLLVGSDPVALCSQGQAPF